MISNRNKSIHTKNVIKITPISGARVTSANITSLGEAIIVTPITKAIRVTNIII